MSLWRSKKCFYNWKVQLAKEVSELIGEAQTTEFKSQEVKIKESAPMSDLASSESQTFNAKYLK